MGRTILKSRCRKNRFRSGFTLVEVLIALLFISIALFGYIALQMRLIDSNERILLKQQAILEAERFQAQRVSQIRASRTETLEAISSSSSWEHRSGAHEYQVDGLARSIKVGW